VIGPELTCCAAGPVDIATAAGWLAEGTGAAHASLPGGHAGFVTDAEAFAQMVSRTAKPPEV
jgi:hypothetical protein